MLQGDGRMKRIGVLDLQGGVSEHLARLKEIENVMPIRVKYEKDLEELDGLIIPGGESTALSKLLHDFKLFTPLQNKIKGGLPVWGTCAGMILLSLAIEEDATTHLQVMGITVKRNAYGRQLGSFETDCVIPAIQPNPIHLVFIRAPFASKVGASVEVLLELDGHIVACKEGHMLATAFHPELTSDLSFHRYFVEQLCF